MNTMTRKQFGRIALAAGLALGMGTVASAQDGYPNKPITMVVPASAGGTTDLAARMTAQALGPVLGQTLVVENRVAVTAILRRPRSSVQKRMATRC